MTAPMAGIRILEVAEHTFVPAASALLSDWGAEVIKIEPIGRGDAMRGLASSGVAAVPTDVHLLLEHSNRGKRSLALDLTTDEGRDILYQLAATADIFLTNKLPSARAKLKIDVADIRAHNPSIIYVRGHGQGDKGPDADRGSYDALAFWSRSGVAAGLMREGDPVPPPPAPGFGDSIGAMTIAGGMMGALVHRLRTGEGVEVDVSLLGTGLWAMGQALALSLHLDMPWAPPPLDAPRMNPLVGNFLTADGRWLSFCCLQAARYWPDAVRCLGRPELADDPRFADHASLMGNSAEAVEILKEVIAGRSLADWREALADFSGQWTVVQNTIEVTDDAQTVANGYVQELRNVKDVSFRLAAAPVQFDGAPAPAGRAPDYNEHGDDILAEMGLDWDTIVDLKVKGVVG